MIAELDVRLLTAAIAAWLGATLGLLLGAVQLRATLIAAVTTLLLAAVAVWRRSSTRGSCDQDRFVVVGVGLAALAVGLGSAALRLLPLVAPPIPQLVSAGAALRGEVVLTGDPVQQPARVVGDRRGLAVTSVPANLVRLTARGRTLTLRVPVVVTGGADLVGLAPGTTLAVAGVFRPVGYRIGIAGVVSLRDPVRVVRPAPVIWSATTGLRGQLRTACAGLSPDVRGLLPGLSIGDVSAVPSDLIADMKVSGLTHLVAVSGTNTALVLTALLALCAALRLKRWLRVGLALAGLGGFILLVRPQPSVSRAAVMGLIAVLALVVGGRRRALPALCAAVLSLVLIDPWLAVSYGFALSTCATAGLVLVAPFVRDRLVRGLPWCPEPLLVAVSVSLAAQLAAAPLLASLCGYVSVVSLPANVLAAPAVGPATVLGVLATVVAPASHPVAVLLVHLAAIPTAWIAMVAHYFAGRSWAVLPWPSGIAGGLAIFAALGFVVALAKFKRRLTWLPILLLVAGLLVGQTVVQRIGASPWPPANWVLVACDVGQGDALVIRAGPTEAVVVDAGPDPKLVDGCLKHLGISRVRAVVLTHFHADHVAGLAGVLHGRKVDVAYASPYPDPAGEADIVRRTLAQVGLTATSLHRGTSMSFSNATIHVIWPPAPTGPSDIGMGPNDDSVVLLVEFGSVRLLLMADAGLAPQVEIERAASAQGVSVIQVAHHGSAYQAPGFARWLHPPLALISVGAGNSYGHPAAVTVAAYQGAGAVVLRTDESGDLVVCVDQAGKVSYATRH